MATRAASAPAPPADALPAAPGIAAARLDPEAAARRPWLASYEPGVPQSVAYPEASLPDLLRQTARRTPDAPAITFYGRSIAYRRLDALVDRFAAALQAMDVRPGDRVGLH